MGHPLDGCDLKLDRAKVHMTELDHAFRSYLRRAVPLEHRPDVGDLNWHFEIKEDPLRDTFPLIIGESIQNMRTALDYLVYELAWLAGANSRKRRNTQFPISTTGLRYFHRGRHHVWPLLGEHRRRIRKLQPYQTKAAAKSQPLAVLNRLSNTDKHRLLLTVVNQLGAIQMNLGVEGGKPYLGGSEGMALPVYLKGTEALEEIKSGNPDLGGILWMDLALDDEDLAVFDTLKRLLWTVTEIIDEFRPAFAGTA